jgi:thioredoxin-disulfide reductase
MDAIVIGKGPAGITAAIYLKRANLDVAVIGKDFGALEQASLIENYYGLERPLSGRELAEIGQRQAEQLGIRVISEEVTAVEALEEFTVRTNRGEYRSRAVLLATGKARREPEIDNFAPLKGKGISFCAVCDGFFYRKKKVGVLGNGDYALEEAEQLLRFTPDVTLFTDGLPLPANMPEGLKSVTAPVRAVLGAEKLEGLSTESGEFPLDGLFVAIGTATALDFAKKIGIGVRDNRIQVDDNFMTNVPGLFAAGDTLGGFLQVSKAAADGALAAKGMIAYLKRRQKEIQP